MTFYGTLKPNDDRVVELNITDQYGNHYAVTLEFVAHNYGNDCDEVNVNIYKPVNEKIWRTPNAIVHYAYGSERRYPATGVWFEFHAVNGKERVTNKEA